MPLRPRNLVAVAYVADLRRSMAFYEQLGFEVGNTHAPEGEEVPVWAALESGDAALMLSKASAPVVAEQQAVLFYLYFDDIVATHASLREDAALMLSKASAPVVAEQQAVLFYLYFDDIVATHASLREKGLAVGEMSYPFYCPKGEFRLLDPDGYVLMLTHT